MESLKKAESPQSEGLIFLKRVKVFRTTDASTEWEISILFIIPSHPTSIY